MLIQTIFHRYNFVIIHKCTKELKIKIFETTTNEYSIPAKRVSSSIENNLHLFNYASSTISPALPHFLVNCVFIHTSTLIKKINNRITTRSNWLNKVLTSGCYFELFRVVCFGSNQNCQKDKIKEVKDPFIVHFRWCEKMYIPRQFISTFFQTCYYLKIDSESLLLKYLIMKTRFQRR